jgi:hypothetical protein
MFEVVSVDAGMTSKANAEPRTYPLVSGELIGEV